MKAPTPRDNLRNGLNVVMKIGDKKNQLVQLFKYRAAIKTLR